MQYLTIMEGWKNLCCCLAFFTFLLSTALGEGGPRVTLDGLGVLEGKEKQTIGNLGVDPKTFYSFRNIPYAHMVSGQNRYKQATKWTDELGTEEEPYDATENGPICFQSTRGLFEYTKVMNTNFEDIIYDMIVDILASFGVDVPDDFAPGFVTGYICDLLTSLVGLEVNVADLTLGGLMEVLFDVQVSESEECLHLAVSTPYDPTNGDIPADLPVMFWVHGGGFSMGWGELGNDLVRIGEVADVVLVAINYRVGPLGFTCLDTEEAAGNMGMLDMVEALKWVQEHIHKFGGDKDQVTIFGQSAGSAAIGHLVLSPLTDGLFKQGIGQSGSALSPWAFDEEPEYHAKQIAAFAGCEQDDVDALVTCLRKVPAADIREAFNEYEADERLHGRLGFGGSIPCAQTKGQDKFYSKEDNDKPETLLIEGNYRELPIFFGTNSHEGSYVYGEMYQGYVEPNDVENDTELLTYELVEVMLRAVNIDQSYAISDLVEDFYFMPDQMGNLELMTPGLLDLMGTFFIKASSYAMVEYNADRAASYWYSIEHASRKSMYHFMFLGDKPKYVDNPGVCHMDELFYMYNVQIPLLICDLEPTLTALVNKMIECQLDIECITDPTNDFMTEYGECLTGKLTPEEEIWSDKILRAWTNFVYHSDPTFSTEGGLPTIEPWSRDNPSYLLFDKEGVTVEYNFPDTYNEIMLEESGGSNSEDATTEDGAAHVVVSTFAIVSAVLIGILF